MRGVAEPDRREARHQGRLQPTDPALHLPNPVDQSITIQQRTKNTTRTSEESARSGGGEDA